MAENKPKINAIDADDDMKNYKNSPFIQYYQGFQNTDSLSFEISLLCECERIWILFDENQDGELDFDEIYNYISTGIPYLGLNKEEIRDLFDEIDEDGNGILDRKELLVLVKRLITKDVKTRQDKMFVKTQIQQLKRQNSQKRLDEATKEIRRSFGREDEEIKLSDLRLKNPVEI